MKPVLSEGPGGLHVPRWRDGQVGEGGYGLRQLAHDSVRVVVHCQGDRRVACKDLGHLWVYACLLQVGDERMPERMEVDDAPVVIAIRNSRGPEVGTQHRSNESALGHTEGRGEAYAKLVWFIIRRRGIADGGHPAAEDVFQETFCGLHRQLRRGLTLERARLATYVSCAAVHACARALEKARRAPQVSGEGNREPEPEGDASGAQCGSVLHPEAVEVWEDVDRLLTGCSQGSFVNRIILAYDCIEAQSSGDRCPVAKMLEDWQRLAALADKAVSLVYERVTRVACGLSGQGAVLLAAKVINAGRAELRETPVILAACEGIGVEATQRLLKDLSGLSAGDVHVRRCRLYSALQLSERRARESDREGESHLGQGAKR